jgi:Coenzyme PQQ synthesis protein D (PqqD)
MTNPILLAPDTIVHRAKNVIFSDLDNELLILDGEAGMVHSLNITARAVWLYLDAPISCADLREKLCATFAIEPSACEQDLSEILSQLQQANLVELVTA